MKKVGAVSAETKANIITSAVNEFAKNGYQNSSLRTICSNAGVTTGALYFFFKNKEDLFNKIIDSVMTPLENYMHEYYAHEKEFIDYNDLKSEASDYEFTEYLVDSYIANKQIWNIFLSNLVFPTIKKRIHIFIEESTNHYKHVLATAYEKKVCNHIVDDFAIHQFVHAQVSTILTLFYHHFDDNDLKDNIKVCVKMLRGAFFALLED